MIVYVVGSWIAVGAANRLGVGPGLEHWAATGWPVTLVVVYAPMLYLVLRRGRRVTAVHKLGKERRRPHRLPDADLTVDVQPSDEGQVTVTVTHLPTQLSSTESAPNRKLAERKAQDKLAALVAEMARRWGKAVNE
jgi:hypothetical protein